MYTRTCTERASRDNVTCYDWWMAVQVTWPRLISVADKRPLGLQRVLSSGRSRAGLGDREIVRDT